MSRDATAKAKRLPSQDDLKRRLEPFESLEIKSPIAIEERFKIQLDIGEDAYTSLRAAKIADDFLNAGSMGLTVASLAQLPFIATTFFPAGGVLGLLGLASAATPVGWVIAAGALSGLGWFGIRLLLKKEITKGRIAVVPFWLNTSLDLLGLALFDLITPLALKMALVDGELHDLERCQVIGYLTKKWGFHPNFVEEGIGFHEESISQFEIENLAETLAVFAEQERDCNYDSITKKIEDFLQELIESDGKYHPEEEKALERIKEIFRKKAHVS